LLAQIAPVGEQSVRGTGDLETEPGHQARQARIVVVRDALLVREDADHAVHRTGVDIGEAEAPGERPAGARLAGPGGTGAPDPEPPHAGSPLAPSSARRVKKPGNDTSAQPGSSISTPSSATRPATANAIAIRWSPPVVIRPPRNRRPPVPSITRPSAVACTS